MNYYFSVFKFKVRYLILYIFFGLFAIGVEFLIRRVFLNILTIENFATFIGIFSGILFAYWSNIKFNFQIPPHKLKKVIIYFFLISFLSKLVQALLISIFNFSNISYESSRLLSSFILFSIFYFLNFRYTFKHRAKIGVAIYTHQLKFLKNIYAKVRNAPDFIQIDYFDSSINNSNLQNEIELIKSVKNLWRDKFIELHLMTNEPKKFLLKFQDQLSNIDLVIVYENCEDDFEWVISFLNEQNIKFGIFFEYNTNIEKIRRLSTLCYQVTFMGIKKLGVSGQELQESTFEILNQIEKFENRKEFLLEIDGGVSSKNFYKFKVDKIVSASSVLSAKNPFEKIIRFKNNY